MLGSLRWLVVVVSMLGVAGAASPAGDADTVRTVFTVEGMHCGGCSSAITAALEKLEGVESASADHEQGRAEAVYHPDEVTAEELKAAIEKLGYTVTATRTEPATSGG